MLTTTTKRRLSQRHLAKRTALFDSGSMLNELLTRQQLLLLWFSPIQKLDQSSALQLRGRFEAPQLERSRHECMMKEEVFTVDNHFFPFEITFSHRFLLVFALLRRRWGNYKFFFASRSSVALHLCLCFERGEGLGSLAQAGRQATGIHFCAICLLGTGTDLWHDGSTIFKKLCC